MGIKTLGDSSELSGVTHPTDDLTLWNSDVACRISPNAYAPTLANQASYLQLLII